MYDKILALIQEHGPLLPVEVAGKTNMNSFLAKAYMEELVAQGKLVQGDKIGSTPIFLAPGQEALASQRAEELLAPTRTVATHVGKELDMSSEAVEKRERFKRHFEKAISEPEPAKTTVKPKAVTATKSVSYISKPSEAGPSSAWHDPWAKEDESKLASSAESPKIIREEKQVEQLREPTARQREPTERLREPTAQLKDRITRLFTPKKTVVKAEKPKIQKSSYVAPVFKAKTPVSKTKITSAGGYVFRVRRMFEGGQAKLIEEISEKKKQGEFVIDFPSSIGAVRYYVTVYDKRAINKSDIALAYTAATNRKLPALLITNGKLASTAEDYADELGGMFRWKVLK